MAIQVQGANGVTAEVDGTAFAGQRVAVRPLDPGASGGQFSYGGFTGILPAALGANSEVFQFRWSSVTKLAIITRVQISASVSTTFFAAGVPVQIDMVKSTAWSVAGTGGAAVDPSTFLKKRATLATSVETAGDFRIATTAALGAGTKTLESLSIASLAAGGPITGNLNGTIFPLTDLFDASFSDGEYPLVLTTQEGFSIRSVAVPGTGTWTMGIKVTWMESAAF